MTLSGTADAQTRTLTPIDIAQPMAGFNAAQIAAESAAGTTIPIWSASIKATQDGGTYSYHMVGQDPSAKLTNPSTTVVVPIVPVIITMGGTTFDPTTASCGETRSPLATTLASPVFNSTTFTTGGTNVGTTQYADAFQRANLWTYTNPKGINPGYHVLLSPVSEKAVTVTVPAADGEIIGGTVGCGAVGEVLASWAVNQIQRKFIPKLAKAGVTPTTFPIFVTHNVVGALSLGSPFVAEGEHASFANPKFGHAAQTWAFVGYDDFSGVGSLASTAILSHEVGEWMDDPFVNNSTPSWGNIGQVSGCQANLEVGDPLTGTNFSVALGGVSYALQDLAFLSWFYGQSPSTAVNGRQRPVFVQRPLEVATGPVLALP